MNYKINGNFSPWDNLTMKRDGNRIYKLIVWASKSQYKKHGRHVLYTVHSISIYRKQKTINKLIIKHKKLLHSEKIKTYLQFL